MDDREDLFKPYEYDDESLAEVCSDIKDQINDEADCGDCSFKIKSLKARLMDEENVRVEFDYYPVDDRYAEDHSAFTINISDQYIPIEDTIYDMIAIKAK